MSDHYCHSLVLDPFDNQSLLRASGDVRDFHFVGRIHRSTNGGKSWYLVKDGLDYYGNGPTRQFGELLCYNPDKKEKLLPELILKAFGLVGIARVLEIFGIIGRSHFVCEIL